MTDQRPKLFVLDTNVILHDCGCLQKFHEHDIAIPIAVLEELDQFKRGNENIHFQAREFLRRLDALTGDVLSAEGCAIGPELGRVRVVSVKADRAVAVVVREFVRGVIQRGDRVATRLRA